MLEKIKNLKRFVPEKKWQKVVAIIVLVLIIIFFFKIFSSKDEQVVNEKIQQVSVSRVFDLASSQDQISLVGTVESQSEAILRSESSGEISYVNKRLGDRVYSREVIAEIKNASQRASVLRAQGVLDGANANLLKTKNSSNQTEFQIQNSIINAYSVADDAVRNKVDQFIEDGDTRTPDMINTLGDYFSRIEIEKARYQISLVLNNWKSSIDSLGVVSSGDEIDRQFSIAKESLEKVRDFLDLVSVSINQQMYEGIELSQGTIDKYKSDVSIARSNINSNLSNLLSTYNTFSSQTNLEGKNQDILAVEAQVTQARAGLWSAQAELEKTIIRSPITGVINSISIQKGDVVTQFQDLGEVVGSGELEVISFVNDSERDSVTIGTKVTIEGQYIGKVVRIAPAINRDTQKVEIRIRVAKDIPLRNGQSVSVIVHTEKTGEIKNEKIFIPITAVKIGGGIQTIFKITDDNTLLSIPVIIGDVNGERIEILSGIGLEDIIVVDVRGLKEGQKVNLK